MSSKFYTHLFLLSLLISSHFCVIAQTNKDSLIQALESSKEDTTKVKLLIKLSRLYVLSDLKKSFEFVNRAITIAKENNLPQELLAAYKAAGKICFDLGLMEDAAKYFNICLEIINKKGNKLEMAMANLNVGAIWLYMEKYEKAAAYHLKSLQLLKDYTKEKKDSSLPDFVINVYNNLGLIYKGTGNIPKALQYYEMGIHLAENNPDYAQTFVFLLHNKGDLLMNQSKFNEADSVLFKSIDVSKELNFVGGLIPSYNLLGEISEKKGKKLDALNYYKNGYKYALLSNSNDLIQVIAHKLQLLYKDFGNTDSAFKYLNISIEAQKKIKIEEAKEELLNKENKQNFEAWQKEENRKNQFSSLINWFIAVVFILFSFVILFFYLNKRKQHNLVLLEKIENELSIQKLELEKQLLETSLVEKEKQLATDVLYQLQKNELIKEVVNKLLIQTQNNQIIHKEVVQDAIKVLSKTTDDNVWSEFEVRFKQVHANFYDNLQLKFPDLTRNERRLCAFLRLNMSTKEIAAISGQSPKTIDVARSRLRKKLGITNDEMGLIAFLNAI